jgi:hypothetical protein
MGLLCDVDVVLHVHVGDAVTMVCSSNGLSISGRHVTASTALTLIGHFLGRAGSVKDVVFIPLAVAILAIALV